MVNVGDSLPVFSVLDLQGNPFTQDTINGIPTVLYFYPKDDTSGCTKEAQGFSDNLDTFKNLGVSVFGVSKDSVKKHQAFCSKYSFKHVLLSDERASMCHSFGVWKEKSMYGKKYMGIIRSTFFVSASGKIQYIWNNVKVPGHVEAVLETVKKLLSH